MLSRLQELKKEEETLLKIKAALHDQLNRLKVEELALQSMITAGEVEQEQQSHGVQPEVDSVNVDDEAVINQTELQLGIMDYNQEEEEEEEEEEEDSDT